ncbi:polyadenylate-binding protein-interacting protein 4-like [Quillaja saponaria]|uniref:Polyadenylate-binding protein-interacting protein 4-like n=1 Tax=Quillaja saponaria TaxID=32244 RepID=A0AAD7LVJ7_QUISA|nr:polyadenylate-binding protein-interacting protein 4-like [Quillaja saponaria]
MGCNNRDVFSEDDASSSSLSEALLFATMCIIGLPVDVHVKNGSIYSGIFHTASVEKDYGIILKKARMTKKGKGDANVSKGAVIDTLVILSGDLVQVVAKGVMFPADGVGGNMAGDDTEIIVGTVPHADSLISEDEKSTKPLKVKTWTNQTRSLALTGNGFTTKIVGNEDEKRELQLNQIGNVQEIEHEKRNGIHFAKIGEASDSSTNERQAGDDGSKGGNDDGKETFACVREETANEFHSSSSTSDTHLCQVEPVNGGQTTVMSKLSVNGSLCNSAPVPVTLDYQCSKRSTAAYSSDAVPSSMSAITTSAADVISGPCRNSSATSIEISAPQRSESTRSAKEFKLNPGAKIFSPSFANPVSASPPVPTVSNMTYMANNSPVLPVAAAQPEVGINSFISRPSVPVKYTQYGNMTAGNGGSGSQFSQSIVGHMGHRTQPLRYAAQYNTVLAEPAYVQQNSPAVMVGRLGQFVYVHPVSHDAFQGTAAVSPMAPRPMLTPNHVQFPKQQATNAAAQAMQFCVPQSLITSGQQQFTVPNHIPLLQPSFPANRPIPIPGTNGFYSTKFS